MSGELKFRSKFEETLYNNMVSEGVAVQFEPFKLSYTLEGRYLPDFVLDNGIIIEAKGYFDARARSKMIAVKKAHPELDIRFVFMNARTKVRKGSDATYADWCKRYGFLFAENTVPIKWTLEKHKNEG